MTIECYYGGCKYHASQLDPDEGPFCDELECRATTKELQAFEVIRQEYLRKVNEQYRGTSSGRLSGSEPSTSNNPKS